MLILVIVISVALPSLRGFFRGRNQESEVRQFLELTRYAQSRAVAEGVPVAVWINPRAGTYGVNAEPGYLDYDPRAATYTVDPDLVISVVQRGKTGGKTPKSLLPSIHFLPEGVVGVNSVDAVSIQGSDGPPIWIVQSPDGMGYEIRFQYAVRR